MPQMTIQQALELAMRHQQAGQMQEVETICRQVLSAVPNHPDALHLLGIVALQSGQFDQAVDQIRRAIAAYPRAAHYHCNLGNALLAVDKTGEAIAAYEQSLAIDPNSPDSLNGLGNALQTKRDYEQAIAAYSRALSLRPAFPEAYNNLGNALNEAGHVEDAIDALSRAVSLKPDYADAHHTLGRLLYSVRRFDEALPHARRAVELSPDFVQAWNNLGTCLHATGDVPAAIEAFRKALRLSPDLPEAHHNLAHSLHALGLEEEALEHAQAALGRRPDFVDARNNLGTCLLGLGKVDEALATYRQALAMAPDDALIHLNIGMTLLLKGDFENGLPEYEWRMRSDEIGLIRHDYPQPCWDGGDLTDRRILLYPEQGFGDAIQFSRFVPLVKQHGGHIILAVPNAFYRLMQTLAGVDELVTDGQPMPDFEIQSSLLSLPLLLGTRPDSIPKEVPYLRADPEIAARWAERLPKEGRKIGICWSGRRTFKDNRQRAIPIQSLAPILQAPGVNLISLQKADSDKPENLLDWTDELVDFAETAALIENLDLIITIDTAVAHLAGAMGKPVWVLLPFMADWRWLRDRDDSPWYPTMRLFRQSKLRDWSDPVAAVVSELRMIC